MVYTGETEGLLRLGRTEDGMMLPEGCGRQALVLTFKSYPGGRSHSHFVQRVGACCALLGISKTIRADIHWSIQQISSLFP